MNRPRRARRWLPLYLVIQAVVLISPGAGQSALSIAPKTFNGSLYESQTYRTPLHCVGDDSLRDHLRNCMQLVVTGTYEPDPSPQGTSSVEIVEAKVVGHYALTSHSRRYVVPYAVDAGLVNITDHDRQEHDYACTGDCDKARHGLSRTVREVQYHYPLLGVCQTVHTEARFVVKIVPTNWYTAMLYTDNEIDVHTRVCAG